MVKIWSFNVTVKHSTVMTLLKSRQKLMHVIFYLRLYELDCWACDKFNSKIPWKQMPKAEKSSLWFPRPDIIVYELINRKTSINTFPLTLWIGSTATATARWFKASQICRILMSTPEKSKAKSWMQIIPDRNHLWSSSLFKHIKLISLFGWIEVGESTALEAVGTCNEFSGDSGGGARRRRRSGWGTCNGFSGNRGGPSLFGNCLLERKTKSDTIVIQSFNFFSLSVWLQSSVSP